MPVHERALRLLRCFAAHSYDIGQVLVINTPHDVIRYAGLRDSDSNVYELYRTALAWTDSLTHNEINFLADYLSSRGLITKDTKIRQNGDIIQADRYSGEYLCRVEIPGYALIEEMETNPEEPQCFVAMWFDPSMDEVYEKGIRPAILKAGYRPVRIDREANLIDKIDDAIVAEIRRSRFLVADFTHGDKGARGGVYYEAGFAHGLGIPVIFMCREDRIDEAHFDTRQFSHILWDARNLEDLAFRLTSKILASMGEGAYHGS